MLSKQKGNVYKIGHWTPVAANSLDVGAPKKVLVTYLDLYMTKPRPVRPGRIDQLEIGQIRQ